MSEDLDQELRRALRPVDPGDKFTREVMARVAAAKVTPLSSKPARARVTARILPWAPAAAAASLLVTIFVTHQQHQRDHVQEGLRARKELLEALRVTSEKLDIAYQVVHNGADAPAAAEADAGV
jgi:hypothetical protein